MLGNEPRHARGLRTSDTGQTAGDLSPGNDRLDCHRLIEACSAFTRVAARTLAPSPKCDSYTEGFSHFVTSMTAPVASGWSVRRVGLAPTGKRRLLTTRAKNGRWPTAWPPVA